MIKQVVLKINIDSIAMDFHESIIQDLVYIYSGILFSHRKEWNNAICSNMDGLRDYHPKRNKLGKGPGNQLMEKDQGANSGNHT